MKMPWEMNLFAQEGSKYIGFENEKEKLK